MKISKKIRDIFSFNLKAELLVKNNGDIVDFDDNKLLFLDKARFIIYFDKNTTMFLNNRNFGFTYENNEMRMFDKNLKIIGFTQKYLMLYDKDKSVKYVYSLNNNKTILKFEKEVGNFINEDYLITDFNSIIQIIDIKSTITVVEFPLFILGTWLDGIVEKSYQVGEFSGIYKSTLVCTMTNGAVLLLDIEKGEVKAFFKEAKVRGGIFQRENNDPIFLGLKYYTFIEINVETGELKRQVDIQNELKRVANIPSQSPCWLGVATSVFVDGLFYFIGDINFVGIFDPVTEKIIDYHWFEFNKKQYQQLKGGIENLQIKDGKIYCLDTLSNLYELDLQP